MPRPMSAAAPVAKCFNRLRMFVLTICIPNPVSALLDAGRYRGDCLMSLVQDLNCPESAAVAVGFDGQGRGQSRPFSLRSAPAGAEARRSAGATRQPGARHLVGAGLGEWRVGQQG